MIAGRRHRAEPAVLMRALRVTRGRTSCVGGQEYFALSALWEMLPSDPGPLAQAVTSRAFGALNPLSLTKASLGAHQPDGGWYFL